MWGSICGSAKNTGCGNGASGRRAEAKWTQRVLCGTGSFSIEWMQLFLRNERMSMCWKFCVIKNRIYDLDRYFTQSFIDWNPRFTIFSVHYLCKPLEMLNIKIRKLLKKIKNIRKKRLILSSQSLRFLKAMLFLVLTIFGVIASSFVISLLEYTWSANLITLALLLK